MKTSPTVEQRAATRRRRHRPRPPHVRVVGPPPVARRRGREPARRCEPDRDGRRRVLERRVASPSSCATPRAASSPPTTSAGRLLGSADERDRRPAPAPTLAQHERSRPRTTSVLERLLRGELSFARHDALALVARRRRHSSRPRSGSRVVRDARAHLRAIVAVAHQLAHTALTAPRSAALRSLRRRAVCALVPDLMDRSRIASAVAGVEFVADPGGLRGRRRRHHRPRPARRRRCARSARRHRRRASSRFGPHVDEQLFETAQRDGADRGLARSRFFRDIATALGANA